MKDVKVIAKDIFRCSNIDPDGKQSGKKQEEEKENEWPWNDCLF